MCKKPHCHLTEPSYRATSRLYRELPRAGTMVCPINTGKRTYRFGLIGSTDSHGGVSSAEETNFWGKFAMDSTPESKRNLNGASTSGPNGWTMSASGLAVVWAEENTRKAAILAAFKRREVYATNGSRIRVQVHGGEGIKLGDEMINDLAGCTLSFIGYATTTRWTIL